jgi:hypothetical protein
MIDKPLCRNVKVEQQKPYKKEFEDTKGVIRIHVSKKNRQHNVWPLGCLFFFDIRILITPLVSSNSSCPFVLFSFGHCDNGQKKKKQKDKQRSTKHTHKTKD